jgi:hypothetical protein
MPPPGIVSVDKTGRGIIVMFDDGKSALYTASFLYSQLLYAEAVYDDKVDG